MGACQCFAIAGVSEFLLLERLVLDQKIVSRSYLGKEYGDLEVI